MYFLEKIPASSFKLLLGYLKTMQGKSKETVITKAKVYLEDKESIPKDELELQLIKEMATAEESTNLKNKITSAKIKRVEKVARLVEVV